MRRSSLTDNKSPGSKYKQLSVDFREVERVKARHLAFPCVSIFEIVMEFVPAMHVHWKGGIEKDTRHRLLTPKEVEMLSAKAFLENTVSNVAYMLGDDVQHFQQFFELTPSRVDKESKTVSMHARVHCQNGAYGCSGKQVRRHLRGLFGDASRKDPIGYNALDSYMDFVLDMSIKGKKHESLTVAPALNYLKVVDIWSPKSIKYLKPYKAPKFSPVIIPDRDVPSFIKKHQSKFQKHQSK